MRDGSPSLFRSDLVLQRISVQCVWMGVMHTCPQADVNAGFMAERCREIHKRESERAREREVICVWQRVACICSVWHTVLSLQKPGHSLGTCAKGQNSLSVSCLFVKADWQQGLLCVCECVCDFSVSVCQTDRLTETRHTSHEGGCKEVAISTEKRHPASCQIVTYLTACLSGLFVLSTPTKTHAQRGAHACNSHTFSQTSRSSVKINNFSAKHAAVYLFKVSNCTRELTHAYIHKPTFWSQLSCFVSGCEEQK